MTAVPLLCHTGEQWSPLIIGSEVKVFIEGVKAAAAAAVWSGSKFGPGRLRNFNFQRFSC